MVGLLKLRSDTMQFQNTLRERVNGLRRRIQAKMELTALKHPSDE
jgi:hypothetical protein